MQLDGCAIFLWRFEYSGRILLSIRFTSSAGARLVRDLFTRRLYHGSCSDGVGDSLLAWGRCSCSCVAGIHTEAVYQVSARTLERPADYLF